VLCRADGDAPLREYWAPDAAAIKSLLRPRLKVEALEAIRLGGAHLTAAQGDAKDGRATRTVLLSTEAGPLGAAALAWPASAPDTNEAAAWIVAAIELVASAVIHADELSQLKKQAEGHRRWL